MGNYMWLDYLPSTAGQIRFGVIKAKSGENVDGDLRGEPRLGKRRRSGVRFTKKGWAS